MEKKIKFRGLTKSNNTFVYGDLINTPERKHRILDYIDTSSEDGHDYITINELVDSSTVGQFTGLYDINNKEIYDGDIVKTKGTFKHYNLEVKFCDVQLCFILTFPGLSISKEMRITQNKKLEVIGNIHQNPELITSEPDFINEIKNGTHKQFEMKNDQVYCKCGHIAVYFSTAYLCGTITAYPCKYNKIK